MSNNVPHDGLRWQKPFDSSVNSISLSFYVPIVIKIYLKRYERLKTMPSSCGKYLRHECLSWRILQTRLKKTFFFCYLSTVQKYLFDSTSRSLRAIITALFWSSTETDKLVIVIEIKKKIEKKNGFGVREKKKLSTVAICACQETRN